VGTGLISKVEKKTREKDVQRILLDVERKKVRFW